MTQWHKRFAKYYEDVLRTSAQSSGRTLVGLDKLFDRHLAVDLAVLGASFDDCLGKDLIPITLDLPAEHELEVESDSDKPDSGSEEQLELAPTSSPSPDPLHGERIHAVRAGRKIQRTQTRDPYNRESILGAPVMIVRTGNKTRSGPLLFWEVELDYKPATKRLRVTRRSPVPEVNTMLLEPFLEEAGDIQDLAQHLQKVIRSADPSRKTVKQLIQVIKGLLDGWEHPEVTEDLQQPIRTWLRDPVDSPKVSFSSVLINTPRTNAVLLQDLRTIQGLGEVRSGSPLGILSDPEDPERDPTPRESPHTFSDTVDGRSPLWYPFESNPSQRRVGHLVERARVLTVQGPPGTGKSLTISNLVCHLVASGKSVLVTSHQRKAVEVVGKLLQQLPDLALPLIKGDRDSSRKLQERIQKFQEDPSLNVATAEQEVEQGMEKLHEVDRHLRLLAHRFQDLSRKENEEWTGFRSYDELRRWDQIHPEDSPGLDDPQRLEHALGEWCQLHLEIETEIERVASLLCPEGKATMGAVEASVLEDVEELVHLGEFLEDSPTAVEVQRAREMVANSGAGGRSGREVAAALLRWIRTDGSTLVVAAGQSGVSLTSVEALSGWVGASEAAPEDRLARIQSQVDEITSWLEGFEPPLGRVPRISDDSTAEELMKAAGLIRAKGSSFVSWHLNPSVIRGRKLLEGCLDVEIRRSDRQRVLDQVGSALEWYARERSLRQLREDLESLATMAPRVAPPPSGTGHRVEWIRFSNQTQALGHILRLAKTVPEEIWTGVPRLVGTEGDSVLDRSIMRKADRLMAAVDQEFRRDAWLAEFQEGSRLSAEWMERLDPLINDLREGMISDSGQGVLNRLRLGLDDLRRFRRIRDLERGPLNGMWRTLEALRQELADRGTTPEWVKGHVSEAASAHQLGTLVRKSLASDPDDIGSVAAGLRKGESRRRQMVLELVRRRHRMHQARALETGNVHAELERVRALLRSSSRLKRSLVALRGSIDYETVLKVFPAWICTIDDAARLFPPEQELFDYVIVDEASQCAQPALFPLALRCKRLVVVGDEKQLRPSFGRFFPKAQLEALQTEHGLNAHRARDFVRGDASLLDLAKFRATASGFLDEHFRCDPAIIAWSNERFYADRLKILTHQRANAFRPPLRVVRLTEADDDPEQKQNPKEAEAVVREVRRLTEDPDVEKLTIGVISPFRKQADLIQGLLEKEFIQDPELLDRHQIISSTADGFQGDERDIVLYSFRMGPSSNPNTIGVLERAEERFNVAFTRARRLAVSFISCSPDRFPKNGVTRSWLTHSQSVQNGEFAPVRPSRPDQFDSEFERKVCGRLRDRGLSVVTQEPCGRFRIDLVVRDSEGRTLAVECDGEWKSDILGQLRPEDYQRQDLIERAGWVVHRVSGRRYLLDPKDEIDSVVEALARQPTARDRAVMADELGLDSVVIPAKTDRAGEIEKLDGGATDAEASEEGHETGESVELASAPAEERGSTERPLLDHIEVPSPKGAGRRPARVDGEERGVLKRLVRWCLQGSQVRGSMFDRLIDIADRLEKEEDLNDSDMKALEVSRRLAESQGFDPDHDIFL